MFFVHAPDAYKIYIYIHFFSFPPRARIYVRYRDRGGAIVGGHPAVNNWREKTGHAPLSADANNYNVHNNNNNNIQVYVCIKSTCCSPFPRVRPSSVRPYDVCSLRTGDKQNINLVLYAYTRAQYSSHHALFLRLHCRYYCFARACTICIYIYYI